MSKQAIIDKILEDAKEKADAIVQENRQKADAIVAAATEDRKRMLDEAEAAAIREANETIARSQTVAGLDAGKLSLGAKRELLDRIFSRALEKLAELDDKTMKALLLSMLTGAAEDGDVVILNARGHELITQEAADKQLAKRKIKVTISPEVGEFAGGMILSGGGADKNLTFESELAALRDRSEADIAKEIFG